MTMTAANGQAQAGEAHYVAKYTAREPGRPVDMAAQGARKCSSRIAGQFVPFCDVMARRATAPSLQRFCISEACTV